MTTHTLTGHAARDYAIAHDLLVSKHVDNGGEYHPDDAVIDEALAADPSLVYLVVETCHIYTHNATLYESADQALTAMLDDWVTHNGTEHPAEAMSNLSDLPESLDVMVAEWKREGWGAAWLVECTQSDYEASIEAVRADLEMDLAEELAEDSARWVERLNGQ